MHQPILLGLSTPDPEANTKLLIPVIRVGSTPAVYRDDWKWKLVFSFSLVQITENRLSRYIRTQQCDICSAMLANARLLLDFRGIFVLLNVLNVEQRKNI